jgi:iron complex transport system permease protein
METTTAPLATAPKRLLGVLALLGALVAAGVASIAVGATSIPFGDSFAAIFDPNGTDDALKIRELRGPRTLVAITVGAALGVAGALIQGMTRNPLADPWILGIESGAALAVVVAIFALGVTASSDYAWFALAGAAIAWTVVYVLGATGRGRVTPINLTLAGAAMGALLAALTSAVIVLDAQTLDEYRRWVVGSVADRDLGVLAGVLPVVGAGLLIALLGGRSLNALSLGEDVARSLGQRVAVAQVSLAGAIVLLAGGAVAIAGPIAFVGLTVPHAARALAGPDYRWVVPLSALLGAILLLTADIVGRVIAPAEVPVGIVTAAVGAPVFIALVRRRRLAAL